MTNYNPEFDKEFENDQEVEEELDAFMLEIAKMVAEYEKGVFVTDPEQLKKLMTTYKIMQRIVKGKNVKVIYGLNQPSVSMGFVSINGSEINISNPTMFVKAASLATGIEMCPMVNGTVEINLAFNNLARKVRNLE